MPDSGADDEVNHSDDAVQLRLEPEVHGVLNISYRKSTITSIFYN
jgi:hypothetical protein